MARCDLVPEKLPKYVILIRYGTFRLDLVGRWQIIAAITAIAGLFGLKFWFF